MKTISYSFGSIIKMVLLAIVVSFYLFPIGFRGLPESLNSKQMLAVLGVAMVTLKGVSRGGLDFNLRVFISFLYAIIFSVWCYFVCTLSNTADYAYAKYFLSFLVWIGGAYAVIGLIRSGHGDVNLSVLTQYIVAVCVIQCVLAQLVNNIPWLMDFVDKWIIQDITPKNVKRLYAIGCSLDSGGVRLCMAEILIAHQIVTNKSLLYDRTMLVVYIVSLILIGVLGNMIARTTTVGLVLALVYYVLYIYRMRRGRVSKRQIVVRWTFVVVVCVASYIGVYLYRHNIDINKDLRFAFEGFFNLFEKGEFSTGSTDTLNERMWIWPWDFRGWMMGYGHFEWSYWGPLGMQTDIGYCRFTLYCGLIGLAIFSLYFIYNASVVARKFKDAKLLSLVLIALTFIIWIKVSTDIFQLYALLFCLPRELEAGSE